MITSQQLFGVIIRTFGLVIVLMGLYNVFSAIYLPFAYTQRPHASSGTFVTYGIAEIVISLYLLRGAPGLVRFCYPAAASSTDTQA